MSKGKKRAKQSPLPPKSPAARPGGHYWLFAILAAAFLAYLPLLRGQFINYDDDVYILDNPLVQQLSAGNIRQLFTGFFGNQYAPLAMLLMGLEFKIFAGNTMLLKLASLLLHLANTLLVFRLVGSLFKGRAYAILAAALFALNPMQVESVAWMSASMKVGVSTLFFLASLIVYLRFINSRAAVDYTLSLGLFLLACLCKEQAITLAATLPLIDYLKGRQWLSRKVLLEKAPYLALALVFGFVTLSASKGIELNLNVFRFGFGERLLFASYAIVSYWVTALIPARLSFFYFYPQPGQIPVTYYLSIALLLAMAAAFYLAARRGNKTIVFGMAFFLINTGLILVSQLMAVRDVLMADRYIYLSSVGIFLVLAEGYTWLARRRPALQKGLAIGLALYAILLGVLSFQRVQVFKDSISLFTDVTDKALSGGGEPSPYLALPYTNRGQARNAGNDPEGAMADYSQAIAVNPGYSLAFSNRGNLYFNRGEFARAIEDYNRALELKPGASKPLSNRGAAHAGLGNYAQALEDLNKALEIEPTYQDALNNRMLVHYYLRNLEPALADCNRLLELKPGEASAINFRGTLYQNLGRMAEAEADFNQSIQLNPSEGVFYLNRSAFYSQAGNRQQALQDALRARALGASVPDDYLNSLR